MKKEELLKNRIKRNMRCIYFLFDGDEIVYVGQCKNGILRINEHSASKGKKFDSYCYIECDKRKLNQTEFEYIVKFAPKYNKSLPPNNKYIAISGFIKKHSIPLVAYKNISIKSETITLGNRTYHKISDLKAFFNKK